MLESERDAEREFFPPLDRGIACAVYVLMNAGIETYESCQGGEGHSYPEPAVRFHGGQAKGFHALSVVREHGLPVSRLSRFWSVIDGEPVGPSWELTFWKQLDAT